MMKQIPAASLRLKGRMAGVCQLLEAVTATIGQVIILGKLVVAGNAAATAANILNNESLFWLGFTSSLLGVAFHTTCALLFYELFKPVNKTISLLAAFLLLVGCAVQALTSFLYIAPLLVLQGGSSMSAFSTDQLQALASMFLKLNGQAFDMHLVFFGFWCFLVGYLIFKSTFLPRLLGILLSIAGLGWLIFLSPPLGHYLFPVIAAASAIGEIPVEFWLMIKSVNVERWKERAGM